MHNKYFMPGHGGNLKEAELKYKIKQHKFIDFSSNINPLGLSPKIRKIITASINDIVRYPDPKCIEVRMGLSEILDIPAENILMGNGSIDLIYLIIDALKPARVLMPIPTFSEYERACIAKGAEPVFLEPEDKSLFNHDANRIINFIPNVDMVFLCNPNNPTGTVLPSTDLRYILKKCEEENVVMVIDEAFIDFTSDPDSISMIKAAVDSQHLVILRSLTKFYALPGLRIGYLTCCEDLIKKFNGQQYPWHVNLLAQKIAAMLTDTDYIEKSRKCIFTEREYLFNNLKQIAGIGPYDPSANYIFCKITRGDLTSDSLADILGNKGILIRDCSNYRGLDNRFFRVAVKKRVDNIKLIQNFRKILSGKDG